MSEHRDSAGATGTLGSIRQLEVALDASSQATVAAEARLEEARTEASRIVAAALDEAAAAAAEYRGGGLAAAADEVAAIHRAGEDSAARLRSDARQRRAAAVDTAVGLILQTTGEPKG